MVTVLHEDEDYDEVNFLLISYNKIKLKRCIQLIIRLKGKHIFF